MGRYDEGTGWRMSDRDRGRNDRSRGDWRERRDFDDENQARPAARRDAQHQREGRGYDGYDEPEHGRHMKDEPVPRNVDDPHSLSASYGNDRRQMGSTTSSGMGMTTFSRPRGNPWQQKDYGQTEAGAQTFRGKGPKSYRRLDSRIHEDVCDALTDDGMVDATGIEVRVSDGEVTLDGTVSSREQRRQAEDCAEQCSGVKHVQNNLRIKEASS